MNTEVLDKSPAGGPRLSGDRDNTGTETAAGVRLAVAALTLVAGALYAWGLSQGATHYYYSAAVRSMSESWHAFLFGSLDPAGSLTVDKLPGALWVQALFVRVLGFHRWVLLLPQLLAAAGTVPLLFSAVRRWMGLRAGIIASAVFTLSPVTYVTARINIPDTLLVLCLVAAAYALTRALDGSPGWTAGCGALIGLAFQMKMLEALLPLPSLLLAYIVCARLPQKARLVRAALLGAVAVVVSLTWMTVVSLVPAGSRPHVDGGTRNSVWEMVFVYNGTGRGTGDTGSAPSATVPYGGQPGVLRLFNEQLGGQISWLLPLALVSLAIGAWAALRSRDRRAGSGWIMWGGWLLISGAAFSAAPGIHPYYAVLLAPAVAALVGAGIHEGLRAWCRHEVAGWAVLLAVAATGAWACVVISRVPHQQGWLLPLLVIAVIGSAALGAAQWMLAPRRNSKVLSYIAGPCVATAVLTGPTVWIALTPPAPAASMHTTNPVAGPQIPEVVFGDRDTSAVLTRILGMPPGGPPLPVDAPLPGTSADPELVRFLLKQRADERYLFATADASSATPYIAAGHSVLPMGGFTGSSAFPARRALDHLVRSGQLRYLLITEAPNLPGAMGARAEWATAHCSPVAPTKIYSKPAQPQSGAPTLFDCGSIENQSPTDTPGGKGSSATWESTSGAPSELLISDFRRFPEWCRYSDCDRRPPTPRSFAGQGPT